MNLKKFFDAANAAEARVQEIAAQIEKLFDEGKTAEAVAMRSTLDDAKTNAKNAHELYLSMLNAQSGGGADPAQRFVPQNGGAGGYTRLDVVRDAADQPFESDGHFFAAVRTAALYPGRADERLQSRKVVDATGMSEGVPADGGYLIRPETSSKWLENMFSTGEILRRISRDPIGANSNGMVYNGIDETSRVNGSRKGGITSGWLGEGGTLSGSKPKFRQVELKLRKAGSLVYATDEQLQDTANLESMLNRMVPEELLFVAEDGVYEGLGGGQPLGIMISPCLISVTRLDANTVKYADVIKMWARRYTGVKDYAWFVNQAVMPQLDSLSLTVGSVEVPPRFIDYSPEGVMRMKGAEVIEVEYASALGTVGDILLASLSQYQAIDKGGVQSASSIHVQFLTDETAFRFIYRFDGKPLWHSAVTPFKGTDTVSPFVALSTAS